MKTHPRIGRPAFTLIELMAVITIIVILAGLVVGGLGYVNERQARSKAQVQIALLSKALEEYKLDMGQYPPTTNKSGNLTAAGGGTGTSNILYQALFYEGYDYAKKGSPTTWVNKATRIYLSELDPTSSNQGWVTKPSGTNPPPPATSTVVDPWGNQYCYRTDFRAPTGNPPVATANSNTQNPGFDLWSMGKDGKSNASNPSMISPATNNPNKDDIRNF
ncbi:MAG: type II secretion system protein GspG [Akkermansiaceae bacterium]